LGYLLCEEHNENVSLKCHIYNIYIKLGASLYYIRVVQQHTTHNGHKIKHIILIRKKCWFYLWILYEIIYWKIKRSAHRKYFGSRHYSLFLKSSAFHVRQNGLPLAVMTNGEHKKILLNVLQEQSIPKLVIRKKCVDHVFQYTSSILKLKDAV